MPVKVPYLFDKALEKRLGLSPVTDSFRVINGRADNMPGIVIDKYNRHFMIQSFGQINRGVIDEITTCILHAFMPEYIVLKERRSAGKLSTQNYKATVILNKSGPETVAAENGLKFNVNLIDSLNTGLFLDMRGARALIRSTSKSKKVLNLFSYTCSVGLYSKSAPALSAVNTDISRKSLDRGRLNYELNNIPYEDKEFALSDSMDYMKVAAKKKNYFDVIMIDPPTFSRSGRKTFSVKNEMPALLNAAFAVLNRGGTIFLSSNYSGFEYAGLERLAIDAAKRISRSVTSLRRLRPEPDFPETLGKSEHHHRAILITT